MIFLTDLSVTFLSFYLCLLFLSTHSNVFPKIPSFAQCSSYKAACLLSCKVIYFISSLPPCFSFVARKIQFEAGVLVCVCVCGTLNSMSV